MKIQRLEAPQNATVLPAGSHSNTLTSSFGVTRSTNAVGTENGTHGASALRSITMRSLHFVRTAINSPIEIHFIIRVCTPVDSSTIPGWVDGSEMDGMLSRSSRLPNRLICHT